MAKKPPFARGRTLCIFCGKGPVTKEHVFGRWIRKYIEANDERTKHFVLHSGSIGMKPGKLHLRQGGTVATQLRVVCGPCNHGWMREIQEAAAHYLVPLLAGDWTAALEPSACLAIASWFTLFSMVCEFCDRPTIGVTQAHRTEFMTTRTPPVGWTVMMGRYFDKDPRKNVGFNHFGFGIYELGDWLRMPKGFKPESNSQITAVAMGRIVLYGLSTSSGEPVDNFGIFSQHFDLPIIWPNNVVTHIRPPVLIHNFSSWSALSNDLMKRHNVPHIR
jgi:hypothetical protein